MIKTVKYTKKYDNRINPFVLLIGVITVFFIQSSAIAEVVTENIVEKVAEDSDGDGLSDIDEARIHHTDSQLADTDTDGLPDGLEVNVYWTLPLVADTDGDGFLDGIEVRLGTDPTEAGSKPDPTDPRSQDLDGDGIPNAEEQEIGSDPQRIDSDYDDLDDRAEIQVYFTNPTQVDSDGDGVWDGEEVRLGTDPGDAGSTTSSSGQANQVVPNSKK